MPKTAISLYFFFAGLIFSSWASRIPDVKDMFALNEAELGAVLFMLPLGALLALPVAGWVVHRLGSKRASVASLLLYTVLLFLISKAHSVLSISIVLFLFGVIGNFANIAMNTQGLSVQHKLKKPILSGLHAMWSLGAFLAAAITGWTMSVGYSMEMHFGMIALAAAGVTLFFSFSLIQDVAGEHRQKVFALPNRGLLLMGIICFCVAMSEGAMADWSSLYYRQVVHELNKVSTVGYTAFALCMALGRFFGDRLLQALGYSSVLKLNGILVLIGMGLALAINTPEAVIIGFALVGFGVSSVIPIVYMRSAKSKSMAPSAAIAAVSSIGFMGFLFGPPIIGFIAQETGLRLALSIVAFLGMMIWLLSIRMKTDQIS
jgi:MFS family permease